MPKYRVETSAGTYEIESDREPTANDVESYLRQSESLASAAPATETVTAEVSTPTESVAVTETAAPAATPTQAIGDDLKSSGWETLNRTERLNLFVRNLPKYFGQELIGIGKGAEGMAERTIPTVVGQNVGRASRLPYGERVGGAVGAMIGETIAQTREDGTAYRPGAILGAGISGAVTGKPLSGAGQAEVMREGAKYAAADLAGTATATAVDEGRAPTVEEAGRSVAGSMIGAQVAKALARPKFQGARDQIDALETQTLRDLQKEGVLVPPHKASDGFAVATSLAGSGELDAAVSRKNRFVWQKLAREDVGLSKDALPITVKELESRRAVLAKPYEEITDFQTKAADELKDRLDDISKRYQDPHDAAIALNDPQTKPVLDRLKILAAADVEELKKVRDVAKSARKAFDNGDPKAYDVWKEYQAKADDIEAAIDLAAQEVGDPTLLERLRASRKQIAQTYTVENALNQGNGMVDPLRIAQQLQDGSKLSGNLEKIAKFQMAFRKEALEASRTLGEDTRPGRVSGDISVLGLAKKGIQGTLGRPAKAFLLSDAIQEGLTNPQEVQNFSSALARYVSENMAQEQVAP